MSVTYRYYEFIRNFFLILFYTCMLYNVFNSELTQNYLSVPNTLFRLNKKISGSLIYTILSKHNLFMIILVCTYVFKPLLYIYLINCYLLYDILQNYDLHTRRDDFVCIRFCKTIIKNNLLS